MATKSITSITESAARKFVSENPERSTLFCSRIAGLHIIKLKRGGSWRYRYTDDAGKRKVATIGAFPALKPAQAAEKALAWRAGRVDVLKERSERKETAQTEAEAKAARTLGAFLNGPYTRIQARKKGGKATLALLRRNFPEFLERDMATLSARDIHTWQDRAEAKGKAHVTLKREYSALKTALNAATRTDPPILGSNPLAKVKLQQPVDNDRSKELAEARHAARRLLTDDEIQGFHVGLDRFAEEIRAQRRNSREHGKPDLPDLDAVEFPHWFQPFALTALYTGMRPGDLYTLTWQEANVNFKRITKTPEKTKHHPEPAQITLDMAPPLLDTLKRWHKQQGKPQTGLVFPSPVTGEEMDKYAHRRGWKHVKELGGLPDDLAFYSLRHHFISTMVANGVPLLTVARLVGQKSTAMIERHYGHLAPSSASDALNALARSVERKPEAANE